MPTAPPRVRGRALAFAALVWLAAGLPDSARSDTRGDVNAIKECAAANLPGDSGRIGFGIEVEDRAGEVTLSRAELLWRRDSEGHQRVVIRVSEPAKIAGTSMLMIENSKGDPDLFVHLPELSRVKRVRGRRLRGPILGTDFSFEDLDRLRRPITTEGLRLIGTRDVEESPAWVLEFRPRDGERSEYERVVTYVEQGHCLPIRIEFYETLEQLRKVLTAPASAIRSHGAFVLPDRFVMRDVASRTETRIHLDRVDSPAELSDAEFTKDALRGSGPAASAP
jgi:hypothetical protein